MADLIPTAPLLLIEMTNEQRHQAALWMAARHEGDPSLVARFLVQLGLAEQQEDGCFTSVPDAAGKSWFSRSKEVAQTLRIPIGSLDDVGQ